MQSSVKPVFTPFKALCRTVSPYLLSYAAALLLIVAITWPWADHFSGFLLDHWDPPFHTWKLELMAKRILRGDFFFFRSIDTNLVYPHGGALYSEALHWPCSVVYAILRATTAMTPEAIYQWVLITFWALTAPCMLPLLKRLGASPSASFFASVAFCILPYRISYVNEFQMQMTFLIPLFYLCLLRFLDKESIGSAILLAFCWWAFAITELYQAIFILFTVPFIVLARLAVDPAPLSRRRFWVAASAGVLSELAFLPVLLLPYLAAKQSGTVDRGMREIIHHSIQPLSYLVPFGRIRLWNLDAKTEELIAYPTLILFILPAVLAAVWIGRCMRRGNAVRRRLWATAAPLALSFLCYGCVTWFLQLHADAARWILSLWQGLAVVAVFSAFALCFAPGRDMRTRFLLGLAAASVLCYFLSLGPTMALHVRPRISVWNPVYMGLFHIAPLLAGFRAACRFGVFVHFFLVFSAALALDEVHAAVLRFVKLLPQAACRVLLPVLALGAIVVEALPPRNLIRFRAVENVEQSPVVRHLLADGKPFSIVVLPVGNRLVEGLAQLELLKDRFLSVSGWCGFLPPFNDSLCRHLKRGEIAKAAAELHEIWPPCHILVDKKNPLVPSPSFIARKPEFVGHSPKGPFLDYARAFAPEWTLEKEDERYVFLRQEKMPARGTKFTRRFRHDYAKMFPVAAAKVRGEPTTLLRVNLNQREIYRQTLEAGGETVQIPVPSGMLHVFGANVLEIEASNPVELLDFELCRDAVPTPRHGHPL